MKIKSILFVLISMHTFGLLAQRRYHQPRVRVQSITKSVDCSISNEMINDIHEVKHDVQLTQVFPEQKILLQPEPTTIVAERKKIIGGDEWTVPDVSMIKQRAISKSITSSKLSRSQKLSRLEKILFGIKETKEVKYINPAEVIMIVGLSVAALFAIAAIVFIFLVTLGGFIGIYVSLMYSFIGTSLFLFLTGMVSYFIALATS